MNDYKKLEHLSKLFQENQREYWRIGDRERPNLEISLFYSLLITLIASVIFLFLFLSTAIHVLTFVLLLLQILLLSFFGWRFLQFKRSMAQLKRSVIQAKDDIVFINHKHFQELIRQVRTVFEKESRDLAEFFCYITAFFGFVTIRGSDGTSQKVILPLIDRWKIPEEVSLEKLSLKILDTDAIKSLPAGQKVGILAALRENIKTVSGMKKETDARQYDFENSIYLLVYLSKERQFAKRFHELVEQFID